MNDKIPRTLIISVPDTRISTPTLNKLANYLHYQYPATTGDIMLNKLCEDIARLSDAYQKVVADGLELKRQRDEWRKDAERLFTASNKWNGHLLMPRDYWDDTFTETQEKRFNDDNKNYLEALAAHNTLLEQMKEKKV